jgi:hypothetical protein
LIKLVVNITSEGGGGVCCEKYFFKSENMTQVERNYTHAGVRGGTNI